VSGIESLINSDIENEITISQLQQLIQVPSISAVNQSLPECASLVSKLMNESGINSQLLYLEKHSSRPDIPPIVYGEVKSIKNPNGGTILFYNHYDVQPPDPLELWESNPFDGKREGNYVFGRGASDDKGELITRIKAVEYFLKKTGDVPCNIKFVVEGEEEIGSSHLREYLEKYRQKLQCDGIIWEFGYVDERDRPIISLGMKGLLNVELSSIGPNADVHSSLAVLIENPAWRLVSALTSLRDINGNILIDDWTSDVREFTPEEIACVDKEEFEFQDFKKNYQVSHLINEKDIDLMKKSFVAGPTCNIAGLLSGYTGDGSKTILPSKAIAKLDFRLVPNMVPEKQFQKLRNYLDRIGFGDIKLKYLNGEAASRTPITNPFVELIKQCAIQVYGEAIVSVSSAGTGPMCYFDEILKAPCVSIGSTFKYSKIHSPNEYARIDLLKKTISCIGKIIERF
jgi:acetylornithine deacetylase/succinyl-diaminopimelate desuccinylase-like protein